MPVRFFELSGASLLYKIWQPVWNLQPIPRSHLCGFRDSRQHVGRSGRCPESDTAGSFLILV
jgi:hypothetical protein